MSSEQIGLSLAWSAVTALRTELLWLAKRLPISDVVKLGEHVLGTFYKVPYEVHGSIGVLNAWMEERMSFNSPNSYQNDSWRWKTERTSGAL